MLTSVLGSAAAAMERCAAIEEELYESQVGVTRSVVQLVSVAPPAPPVVLMLTLLGLTYDTHMYDRHRPVTR